MLDLARLLRDRSVVPGEWRHGTLHWTEVGTGKEVASVGYEADLLDPDGARLRLSFVRGRGEAARACGCAVRLTATRPRLGGRRFWFVCPVSGRRCAKLYLPVGADGFAARQVWGLAYASQRATPPERAWRTATGRAARIRRRLGEEGGRPLCCAPLPDRPRGMWRRTYRRLRREALEAERRADRLVWEGLAAIASEVEG